jgi:WD40-like Beta Propeller Repeat
LLWPRSHWKERAKEMRRTTAPLSLTILAAIAAALATSILIVVLIAAASEPAQAAFPGTNGKIAFVTNRDGNEEIYTMNPDGTSQVNLTRSWIHYDRFPAYSPNGKNIAFQSNRDGDSEIYRMTSAGTSPTQLTVNSAEDAWPSWGPRP